MSIARSASSAAIQRLWPLLALGLTGCAP